MKQETIKDNEKQLEELRKFLIDNNLKITKVNINMSKPVYAPGVRLPVGYAAGFYNVNFDLVLAGKEDEAIDNWNTRPVEDALKAEVEDWYFVLEAELWAPAAMEGLPAEWIRFPQKLHSMEEVVREAIRVFRNATFTVSTIRVCKEWTEEIFTAKSVEELNSRAWESIDVLKQKAGKDTNVPAKNERS